MEVIMGCYDLISHTLAPWERMLKLATLVEEI